MNPFVKGGTKGKCPDCGKTPCTCGPAKGKGAKPSFPPKKADKKK